MRSEMPPSMIALVSGSMAIWPEQYLYGGVVELVFRYVHNSPCERAPFIAVWGSR